MQNLLSKAEFARRAGVGASTITRLTQSVLKKAVVGKKIDANHKDAKKYLKSRGVKGKESPVIGVDPLYEDAVNVCVRENIFTVSHIMKSLKIGYVRAKSIFLVMSANGLVPEGNEEVELVSDSVPSVKMNKAVAEKLGLVEGTRKASGWTAHNNDKKQASLDRLMNEEKAKAEDPDDIRAFEDYTLSEIVARFGGEEAFIEWLKAMKLIEEVHEKRLKNAEKAGELVSRTLIDNGVISVIDGAFTRMLTDGAKSISVKTHAMTNSGASVLEVEDLVRESLSKFIRPTKSKIQRVLSNV